MDFLLIVILIFILFIVLFLIKDIIKNMGFDLGLINTEFTKVSVSITDAYSRGVRTTLIPAANNMYIPITRPPIYKIYVNYENTEYIVYGEKVYKEYKNKIGKTVIGTLEIRTYKNGKKIYDIVDLELPDDSEI